MLAPQIWEYMAINPESTASSRCIGSLLHSTVLKHIRAVSLITSYASPAATYNAKLLLEALPKDALMTYHQSANIASADLVHLLQCQGHLRILSAHAINFSDLPPTATPQSWLIEQSSWISSRLSRTECMSFHYRDDDVVSEEDFLTYVECFTTNAPRLTVLYLPTVGNNIDGSTLLRGTISRPTKLQKLHLAGVDLSDMSATLRGDNEFSDLRTLELFK